MDIALIKEWLIPVSTFVTLVTASVGGWLSLREHRLKVRAETRLARSSELESDIKLLKLFTEIMDIAHGRGGNIVSEKAIESLLKSENMKELGLSHSDVRKVLNECVISLPIGVAAQDAAISAIWVLGQRHDTLMPVAIQALESLCTFKETVARGYLVDLEEKYSGKCLAAAER